MINMEFSDKDKKPFSHIYNELMTKTYIFNPKYKPPVKYLLVKPEDNDSDPYTANSNQNNEKSDFSIDTILSQESEALGDKMMNSAFAVYDRLKIHTYFNERMMYNWLNIKNQILSLDWSGDYPSNYKSQERRISSLEGSLVSIEKDILQEKIKCWQDLLIPTYQFLDLWHKYEGIKEDKKLLE
jgi:hypothetical protein